MKTVATLFLMVAVARALVATISEPSLSQIGAAAATVLPESPVSNVKGLSFDRFYQIWLENTAYTASAADPNMQWLASQGILLTNYHGVTHPSEPNYCAAAGGDTFGMDWDQWVQVPANISSVPDLLDTKGISWAEYQEHLPYAGFQGFNYSNQQTFKDDYVRRHNPLVLYDAVVADDTRVRQIKNFTDFEKDLENKRLPQWAFITPNVTNDAHDTNITFGAKWERHWMSALLTNEYFMNNTLVLLTFDEDMYDLSDKSATFDQSNRVYSILVGGAIPDHLRGTQDDTFYTHYSTIASISANWGLPSLGRWDCGANIFAIVANQTGYINYDVDLTHLYLNHTYPGPLTTGMLKQYFGGSSDLKITAESAWTWPVPNIDAKCSAGNGVLDSVRKTYHGMKATYNYTFPYPWDGVSGYNVNVTATRKSSNTTSTGNNTFTVTQSAISRASSGIRPSSGATLIAVFALFALVS
ncbi:Acid phosphatase [Penicillium oxalicum]|uniref:Acid phosphatase n=1 Tax=Penicillium oxalicum TaxID=69781 RepID=UPI0020B8AE52|nr:Acid phosphatase [Penicillium oxalicum]KAI2788023.1 Acid phosphatase [Penicillium oxalicum]